MSPVRLWRLNLWDASGSQKSVSSVCQMSDDLFNSMFLYNYIYLLNVIILLTLNDDCVSV